MRVSHHFAPFPLTACLAFLASGAAWDVVDPTFSPNLNGRVTQVVVQPDGKIIVAGDFTEVDGVARNHLARLHRDGMVDAQFNLDLKSDVLGSSVITALTQLADGRLLVGGTFQKIGGMPWRNLARLNLEGAVDPSFAAQFRNDQRSFVYLDRLVEQRDGRILVAGSFTSIDGVARNSLARLNQNGTLDPSFDPEIAANDEVAWAGVTKQPDEKVLVYGRLTKPDETYRDFLVRLNPDGSADPDFVVEINSEVEEVVCLEGGKLLIRGDFTVVSGVARRGLARLNPNGTLDPDFDPVGDFEHTYSISPQADGTVLVGGDYVANDRIAGYPNGGGLVALRADGSAHSEFGARFDLGGSGWPKGVWSIANGAARSVYIGGLFSSVDGKPRFHLARLMDESGFSGELDLSFATRVNDSVGNLALQPDGRLVLLGRFTEIDGASRPRVARLNGEGEVDPGFAVPATGATNDSLQDLAVQGDGKILVGGLFDSVGDFARTNLVRLNQDGSVDSSFAPVVEGGVFPSVDSLIVQADSRIVVGGRFTYVNGTARNSMARLDSSGALDPEFNPMVAAQDESVWVFLMGQLPDGKILSTGRLVKSLDSYRHFCVRLHPDGRVEPEFQLEFNGDIEVMAIQADGAAFIAGDFGVVNGEQRRGLARLLPDGTLDDAFRPQGDFESVRAMAALRDGSLLVYVQDRENDKPDQLVLLDRRGAVDDAFSVQLTGWVGEIIEVSDHIVLGGRFETVNGAPQPNLARLFGWSPRYPQARFESIDPGLNATLNFSISGTLGSSAALQSSTNLSHWSAEGTVQFAVPHLQRTQPTLGTPETYYRLIPQ